MDNTRFAQLAGAYGAERRRWPEAERGLFDRSANTPEGRLILADAERLDRALDAWVIPDDDEARVVRIVTAAAPQALRPRAFAWLSTGIAACALLGFVLGYLQVPGDSDELSLYDLLLGSTAIEEYL